MSNLISFLPTPLEGEHILSTMARWAKLQGGKVEGFVFNKVTEHASAFVPTYAYDAMQDAFIKQFNPSKVERIAFIKQHTLLNYYSPLMQYKIAYAIERNAVCYGACTRPKNPRKLDKQPTVCTPQQSKLAFSNVWRWCPSCVTDDELTCGISYWHVAHQIPSTFKCYKHPDETLMAGCENCDFKYRDIRKSSAPPLDSICPKCFSHMGSKTYITNKHTHWLSSASLQLLNQEGTITQPEFGHSMKNGLSGYFSNENQLIPKESIFVADELQHRFNEWLFDNRLEVFFNQPTQSIKERVLSIDVGRTQAKYLPPTSVLLWLRYFGTESLDSRHF